MFGSNVNGRINISIPKNDLLFYVRDYRKEDIKGKGAVYRFFHNNNLIYCGETKDIHLRLNEHFNFDKYSLSEFDRYKKKFEEDIVCELFFEEDHTSREIYESWIIRLEEPIFNILKTKNRYKKKEESLNPDVLLAYDAIYREDLDLDYLDKKDIVCEKNAVILSRMFIGSQLTINEFVNKTIYVKRKEFDKMWKFYKEVAIENKLEPIIENGNLIYNVSFSKVIKSKYGKFVLEG